MFDFLMNSLPIDGQPVPLLKPCKICGRYIWSLLDGRYHVCWQRNIVIRERVYLDTYHELVDGSYPMVWQATNPDYVWQIDKNVKWYTWPREAGKTRSQYHWN